MDKLLCTLGMGLVVVFIKVREWLDGFTGMVKGTDGFFFMMGICVAALILAGIVMAVGGRKKRASA